MKIIFTCPLCAQALSCPPVLSFFKIKCPKCQSLILVPSESAFTDIIEIDAGEVLDPNGEHRMKQIDYLGNERKKYGCSYDEWDKCDNREIP